jgi:transcription elongation GreA/GreB family factor
VTDAAAALFKRAILRMVTAEIDAEAAVLTRAALDAAEGATHPENKPENSKDMRSTEASYLAAGQAERARDLERAIAVLSTMAVRDFAPGDEVALSALVEVTIAGRPQWLLVAGDGGGRRAKAHLAGSAIEVQLVTPMSPLGRALVGAFAGDEVEVATPQGARVVEIVGVR